MLKVMRIRYCPNIDWLIEKRPTQEMQLDRARDALINEGWGFFDLKRKITDGDWRTMKIGNGTVYTIKKRLKEWPGSDNDEFELENNQHQCPPLLHLQMQT